MGIITIVLFAASLAAAQLAGTDMPRLNDFSGAWRLAGGLIQFDRGQNILLLVFAGMWLGAASHTFADMAGTFVKTGRTGRLL